MTINSIEFNNPALCSRCAIITQDINTGHVVSKEMLAVLSSYRRMQGAKVIFGIYWTPNNYGLIQVGDEVFTNRLM